MKILIKENAMQLHARSVPAHMGYTPEQFRYRDSLREIIGQWIEVKAKQQYAYVGIHPEGYSIHIPNNFVEDIVK